MAENKQQTVKLIDGKYFFNECEYTLNFTGEGINVFIDYKYAVEALITDKDLNIIVEMFSWESMSEAYISIAEKYLEK